MSEADYDYLVQWIKDGHYDNGDYTCLQPLLEELLSKAVDVWEDNRYAPDDPTQWQEPEERDQS